jgi:hypothetical protein
MTMPENAYQWLWFAFFAGGALGGWLAAIAFAFHVAEVLRAIRKHRRRI